MKKFFFLLFILVFPSSVSSQNYEETHSKIRGAVENRDYLTAVGELENLENRDKKVFELNNYDYLLARMTDESGDFAAAAANYQAVVNRNSVLSEYALWHLSQTARASGNLMLERLYLRQLLILAPNGLMSEAARARLPRSCFESKDFAAAIQLLSNQLSVVGSQPANELRINNNEQLITDKRQNSNSNSQSDNRNPKKREILALLGQAYLQSGKPNEAHDVFTGLINNLPNPAQPDDFALTAAKALDELDGGRENFGKTVPQLAEAEHFRRASVYQFNRSFALARLHYRAVVERYPVGGFVADSLFQIGRGFTQEANYNEAVNWFERVMAEFPDETIAGDALSQAASAYARAGKPKVAVARYQNFIEKYPDADNLERAYLNIIDILRDQNEDTNALKWAAKTREAFRGKLPEEAVALFTQARIHISLNDWQNALDDLNILQTFSDLGGTSVPGGTNKAEVAFLKGFVLENLNQFNEAIDVYLSIPDGRNEYYGWRASERLRALRNNEKTKQIIENKIGQFSVVGKIPTTDETRKKFQSIYRLTNNVKILDNIRDLYANLPDYKQIPSGKLLEFGRKGVLREKREVKNQNYHQTLADELLFLGLYDEGTPELENAINENQTANPKFKIQNSKSEDLAYTLAVFYRRGNMANRAVAFAEPLWRNVPADYQIELIPREQIELLYPAPFADALLKYAPERNIDARFILSIMRQESRFRADVKSNAAARGLMQFISTTADRMASELKESNFKQDELYNPPTAILFGSQYLSDLFKQFPNQPQAVAASYNGGEDNVLRWRTRANASDADRYVSEIIFAQSKDYVYKVMANYRVYQMFYDEKLKVK